MEGVVRLSAVTAFVITVLVVGLAVLADAPSAQAGPPTPTDPLPIPPAHPSEFLGNVMIDGDPAADGTVIEALIGDAVCGTAVAEDGRYDIVVKAGFGSGNGFQEGCGLNGNTVTFRSGGLIADEEGEFVGMGAQELDLTFGEAPDDPDPTSTEAPGGADVLPQTGAGGVGEGSAARQTAWMSLLLAAGAVAILAGVAARRAAR